nr:DsbA family oxidoreductase [Pseudomonas akapageensis]
MRIDVFFDFICPWCLIGKRQLEQALEQLRLLRPDVEVELAWQGVQLLPHMPAQGEPFAAFYLNRLGSADAVRARQAQVQQAAAASGVAIDLSSIGTMPNTANAHRLLERCAELGSAGQRDALIERLFAAYFHHNEDIGCTETLLAIAESCGFDHAAVADCLCGDASPFVGASTRGVSSVPYFHFNRNRTVPGAQPAEVLLNAMCETLVHSEPEPQPS